MSDGFIRVKPRKSRQRHRQKKSAPQPPKSKPHGEGGWGRRNEDSAWFNPAPYPGYYGAWDSQSSVDSLSEFVSFWLDNMSVAEKGGEMKKYADFLETVWTEEDSWEVSQEANPWGVPDYDARGSEPDNNASGWGQGEEGRVNESGWGEAGKASGDAMEVPEETAIDGGWGTTDWDNTYDPWAPTKASCDEWTRTFEKSRDRQSDDTAKHDSGRVSADDTTHAFVTKVARKQGASMSRKKRMQSFYSMPTTQKVQKIEEVVDFLRKHP